MDNEALQKLLLFIETGVELHNSVACDITMDGAVSNETITIMNNFKFQHDELVAVLDILNGVN